MNDEYEGRKTVGKTSYALRRDLGFKRGTYGRETRDSGSAPSSLLVTGKNFFFVKNPYPVRCRTRNRCVQSGDSCHCATAVD